MSLRPRLRIPLWAALAIPGAAYIARSLIIRGGDLRPDLPDDAIIFGSLLLVVLLVWRVRTQAAQESDDSAAEEPCGEDRQP